MSGSERGAVGRLQLFADGLSVSTIWSADRFDDLSPFELIRTDLKTVLALLSARPLASGGQQDVDEDWIRGLIGEAIVMTEDQERADEGDEELSRISDGILKALRPYLSTTPARAEAQDEGAAGQWTDDETCQAAEKHGAIIEGNHLPDDFHDVISFTPPELRAFLVAHPFPPPAADADRVRITDADAKWLTRWLGDQKEGGHCGEGNVERRERAIWNDRIDRILAALKSTAAKEGGAAQGDAAREAG